MNGVGDIYGREPNLSPLCKRINFTFIKFDIAEAVNHDTFGNLSRSKSRIEAVERHGYYLFLTREQIKEVIRKRQAGYAALRFNEAGEIVGLNMKRNHTVGDFDFCFQFCLRQDEIFFSAEK